MEREDSPVSISELKRLTPEARTAHLKALGLKLGARLKIENQLCYEDDNDLAGSASHDQRRPEWPDVYRVVHAPRVVSRHAPSLTGNVVGVYRQSDEVYGRLRDDGWVQLDGSEEYMLVD